MLCITVTPTSRTLAKVDLLNAARHGDIIELCLDHLAKEPDFKDLLTAVDKPIILSCRRMQDGGQWDGSEDERLMLLRQAIVAGPAYVELDLDIAPRIPRFGQVQRLVSVTRLDRPETDVDGAIEAAVQHQADVVKFAWPTPTLDAAWPLLAAVTQKRRIPIVGQGLGRPELTFSLLGRKYGSPWIYAALERGMEAHAGQATVHELDELYHCRDIDRQTGFVAVTGFGESATATTHLMNAGFRALGVNVRCLPVEPGDLKLLPKMLDVLKIQAVLVFGRHAQELWPLVTQADEKDRLTQSLDLLVRQGNGWSAYNTLWRCALRALELKLGKTDTASRPLERKNVMVLGTGGTARAIVLGIAQRKGLVSICGPQDKQAQRLAAELNCRYVPFQNIYDTLVDVVVIADPELRSGHGHGAVNPSLLKTDTTVMDASDPPREHPLFAEARERRCRLVEPEAIFTERIRAQFQALTGNELPDEVVAAWSPHRPSGPS
jgi:3-dehydroquinate dehydratase/shikimate dehydrogenase